MQQSVLQWQQIAETRGGNTMTDYTWYFGPEDEDEDLLVSPDYDEDPNRLGDYSNAVYLPDSD